MRRPLALAVAAVALAACGSSDGGVPSATTTAPRALDLRVAARAIPAPVGDVDGDRRADVVLVDDDAQRAWLLTSRGRGALVTLDHVSSGPFGHAGHEVVALGDVDGDGLADMALPNDRSGLAIVVRLTAPISPWASGSDPRVAWQTVKPEPARHDTPVVAAPGRRGTLLGPDDVLLGLTREVALVETQPDVPNGANQTAQLKLYTLSSSGTPATRELTTLADLDTHGTMAPAGRCVVLSGWGNTPTRVWAVDTRTLDVAGSWSPMSAASATGAVAGDRVSIVAVSRTGRLSLATVVLPSACC